MKTMLQQINLNFEKRKVKKNQNESSTVKITMTEIKKNTIFTQYHI